MCHIILSLNPNTLQTSKNKTYFILKKKKNAHSSVATSAGTHIHWHPDKQCIDLPYFVVPFQRCQGFPLLQLLRWQCMLQDLLRSQYRFHKPLTSWSPAKKNLGRSSQETVPARQWAHPTTKQAIVVMTNPSWTERSIYPFPSIPSCKISLALKGRVAAHGFLNKVCFNEGSIWSQSLSV